MSESLQGRRTTSNTNTWVANSYYILEDKENRCVLRRFLNVDVSAVRMSMNSVNTSSQSFNQLIMFFHNG